MHIYSDFDGTISIEDATDYVLSRFAEPEWEAIEQEWKQGAIGSAECMQRQIALIHATRQQLDGCLDEIDIDPGFAAFSRLCKTKSIPLTVISDGVDYFIKRILNRHHLDLSIIANRLAISGVNGHTQYQLSSPFRRPECASAAGVCKCRAVRSSDLRVYIGDGQSDFCVSDKPDIVFAKGKLAAYCTEREIPFIAYEQFSEITHWLEHALPRFSRVVPASPSYVIA